MFLTANGFVLKLKKDKKLQDEDESKCFTNIFNLQVPLFEKFVKQIFMLTSIFLVNLHNIQNSSAKYFHHAKGKVKILKRS